MGLVSSRSAGVNGPYKKKKKFHCDGVFCDVQSPPIEAKDTGSGGVFKGREFFLRQPTLRRSISTQYRSVQQIIFENWPKGLGDRWMPTNARQEPPLSTRRKKTVRGTAEQFREHPRLTRTAEWKFRFEDGGMERGTCRPQQGGH